MGISWWEWIKGWGKVFEVLSIRPRKVYWMCMREGRNVVLPQFQAPRLFLNVLNVLRVKPLDIPLPSASALWHGDHAPWAVHVTFDRACREVCLTIMVVVYQHH